MIPIVHNVVATIKIECTNIDIDHLHRILPFTSYDKKKFAAITIRLQKPTCTCLLFTSGKLVVTGANSWEEALLTAYCIRGILQDIYPHSSFEITDFEIQNMVAHVEFQQNHLLNLQEMYNEHTSEITYQPKMFPGLIFRPHQTPLVFLCFSSGKIVITGAVSESQIIDTWNVMEPIIRAYLVSPTA